MSKTRTMQPQISIIVPVYKAEKYLHRCIDSILSQTFADFELILINDGSPDASGEICEDYAQRDNRIKVIHKNNGGASDARNYGLDKAKGDRICFIDSDDIVDADFLEIFNRANADIVIQGIYAKYPHKECEEYVPVKEGYFKDGQVDTLIKDLWSVNNIGYLVTRCFKRSIIETNQIRFNTEYRLREDEEFIWRYMCKCSTFATVNKGAYHYEMPEYGLKYNNIDLYSNCRCTISRLDSVQELLKETNKDFVAYNLNLLSTSIVNIYKYEDLNVDSINQFLKKYKEYYRHIRTENSKLSKKSKFVYCFIRPRTSLFVHKIYKALLKKII